MTDPERHIGKVYQSYCQILGLDTLEDDEKKMLRKNCLRSLEKIEPKNMFQKGYRVGITKENILLAFDSYDINIIRVACDKVKNHTAIEKKYLESTNFQKIPKEHRTEALILWLETISETQYSDTFIEIAFDAAGNSDLELLDLLKDVAQMRGNPPLTGRHLTESSFKFIQGYKKVVKEKILDLFSYLLQNEQTAGMFLNKSFSYNQSMQAFIALRANMNISSEFTKLYSQIMSRPINGSPNPCLEFLFELSKSAHGKLRLQTEEFNPLIYFNGEIGSFDKIMEQRHNILSFKDAKKKRKIERQRERGRLSALKDNSLEKKTPTS
jgi:hypothetical protein